MAERGRWLDGDAAGSVFTAFAIMNERTNEKTNKQTKRAIQINRKTTHYCTILYHISSLSLLT